KRLADDGCDRRDVAEKMRCVDRLRCLEYEERMTVGRCAHDDFSADIGCGARPVLDNKRLGRADAIAMDRSDARGCHSSRRAGMAQSCAPAVSDKLARKRCARQSAARQLPPSDAEIVGGEVSWPPSLQCGRRDALFRLDIGRADYLRPL